MGTEAGDVLPRPFAIDRHEAGDAVVLAPRGELDIDTADRLRAAADAVDGARRLLVVDLRDVSFIDSSGLRGLLLVRRRAERDDMELLVCHDPATHGPIFRLTKLDGELPLVTGDELGARLGGG